MADEYQTSDRDTISTPPELEGKNLGAPTLPSTDSAHGVVPSAKLEAQTSGIDRETFATHVHEYVREYISVADRKASFAFAIGAGLLVYLHETDVTSVWRKGVTEWRMLEFLAFVATVGLSLAVTLAVIVVFPRMSGSRRGNVFWESIAEHDSATSFAEAISKSSADELSAEILRHTYELSSICKSKYTALNWCLRIGGVSAISAVFYLMLAL